MIIDAKPKQKTRGRSMNPGSTLCPRINNYNYRDTAG